MPEKFGRYELLNSIGRGRRTEVFRARSGGAEGFEKILAIKRVLPDCAEDVPFVERFSDAARDAADLSHANIAHAFEFGRIDGLFFVALEYVNGRDLDQVLQRLRDRGEAMPLPLAVHLCAEICAAMAYAHGRGMIHGEIKASNVLISFAGEVKLINFGQTRPQLPNAPQRALRVFDELTAGTAADDLDSRWDLFATGLLLCECLAGVALLGADADHEFLDGLARSELALPRADLPQALPEIVAQATLIQGDDCFHSAAEMQAALVRFAREARQSFSSKKLAGMMRQWFRDDDGGRSDGAGAGEAAPARRAEKPAAPASAGPMSRRTLLGSGSPAGAPPASHPPDRPAPQGRRMKRTQMGLGPPPVATPAPSAPAADSPATGSQKSSSDGPTAEMEVPALAALTTQQLDEDELLDAASALEWDDLPEGREDDAGLEEDSLRDALGGMDQLLDDGQKTAVTPMPFDLTELEEDPTSDALAHAATRLAEAQADVEGSSLDEGGDEDTAAAFTPDNPTADGFAVASRSMGIGRPDALPPTPQVRRRTMSDPATGEMSAMDAESDEGSLTQPPVLRVVDEDLGLPAHDLVLQGKRQALAPVGSDSAGLDAASGEPRGTMLPDAWPGQAGRSPGVMQPVHVSPLLANRWTLVLVIAVGLLVVAGAALVTYLVLTTDSGGPRDASWSGQQSAVVVRESTANAAKTAEPEAATEATKGSKATEATKGSKATEATKGSKATEATKGSKASEATKGSKATEATKGSKATEATKGSKATEATKGSKASKATKGSKATEATKGSKASEATKGSKATEATKGSKASEATKGSKATEATKGSKASEATKGSKATEATEATKGSKAAKGSKASEATKGSKATKTTEPAAESTPARRQVVKLKRRPRQKRPAGRKAKGPAASSPKRATAGPPGFLVVSSRPAAQVYIDGKSTRRRTPISPGSPLELAPGKHTVTLRVGRKRFTFAVTIRSGRMSKLARILPVE